MRLSFLREFSVKLEALRYGDRPLLVVTAAIVGIFSGIAAFVLNRSLSFLLEFLSHYRSYWWALFLPGAGAALSSIFLNQIIKEEPGHGVPEVIKSVSRFGGFLTLKSSFSRLVSSCLTIGSGGSAGPEAPIVISGGSIGSNIARLFSMNERQRITLVGCGAAGAISAIFNAPVTGLMFAMEVILGEWSTEKIIPIAVASVAGTQTSWLLSGNQITFGRHHFSINFLDLPACVGLAIFTAFISILMTRTLRESHRRFIKIRLPLWAQAAIGGCLVGLMGMFWPDILGEGYPSIQKMIEGIYSQGLTIVTIGCFAKVLATAITLGSGGSGGIFAPSLVIGSFAGLTFFRGLLLFFPSVKWLGEGCYALFGMAGIVGGILQAPLSGVFLIVEITGGYDVIVPLIITSVLSAAICHYFEPASIYMRDLLEKGHLLRPGTDARILCDLSVMEILETDCISVKPDMSLRSFIDVIKRSHRNYFPVEEPESKKFLGMVRFDDVRRFLFDSILYDTIFVEQLMDPDVLTVTCEDDLPKVLKIMDDHSLFSIPVVENKRFMGMVSKATILDHYRKELLVQTIES